MTWQLGAFGLLALALLAGLRWYERARPDARIVALVATMAAAAALGRIAFAALPNVKPTTDIVLISGYALGGAPGFAVGAIAGLTSNFFFGQGPWTPWQMAAWGATGALGAGLALVSAKRIGRWPLALVCGVVGFAFAAVQDVGDWVTYSDHSAGALGVYVGKGIGFDFVHAVGCVLFAVVFGPSLVRSLARFARRLQVRWEPAASVGLVAVVSLLSLAGSHQARAAPDPTGYLLGAQNQDGGLGSAPGQPSSTLYSGWAALGLAATGRNPSDVRHGGASLLGYIQSTAARSTDPGSLERTILVARAAGVSARAFGGVDLVASLERQMRSNGSVAGQVNLTSFAVLALRAAGVAPPGRTLAWLLHQQDHDGGFNFATAGGASDVDDTGAALQALAGVAGAAHVKARAVAYIERQQNHDGGFPAQAGEESNAQSTAWAIQGLLAAGANPSSLHRRGAPAPSAFLNSLISSDGHVRYSHATDQTPVWVTAQALMALAGKPLPLAPTTRARHGSHRTRTDRRRRPAAAHSGRARPARRARRHRRAGAADASSPMLSTFATDAACAAALALAPVGLS